MLALAAAKMRECAHGWLGEGTHEQGTAKNQLRFVDDSLHFIGSVCAADAGKYFYSPGLRVTRGVVRDIQSSPEIGYREQCGRTCSSGSSGNFKPTRQQAYSKQPQL